MGDGYHQVEKLCAPMRQLRDELDKRGIEWRDKSYEGSGIVHHEQTLWGRGEETTSVVWEYVTLPEGVRDGITYGWPDMLECWPVEGIGDPEAMTVEEIIERCCE